MEERLLECFGAKKPFTVPEGYFDKLPSKVMSRIAERERRHRKLIAWRWAAAAVLIGCVWAGGFLFERNSIPQIAETEEIEYIEEALDYSMIDNMSIADYLLTEAEK